MAKACRENRRRPHGRHNRRVGRGCPTWILSQRAAREGTSAAPLATRCVRASGRAAVLAHLDVDGQDGRDGADPLHEDAVSVILARLLLGPPAVFLDLCQHLTLVAELEVIDLPVHDAPADAAP